MIHESPDSNRTLRFGIMCSGTRFQAWQARCLRHLLAHERIEPALLIMDENGTASGGAGTYLSKLKNPRNLLWYAYRAAERLLSRALRRVDMSGELAGVPVMHCRVTRTGKFSQYFQPDDVAAIREHGLDFIIRFGFNIIRGEILESARYGVWSFHHDDEQKYRGTPPGFWEVYHDDPVTGSILQRLTDRLDGGVVLKKGFFKTIRCSYMRSRDRSFFDSAVWPLQVCIDIMNGTAAYLDAPPSTTSAPIYYAPTNLQMILFTLKTISRCVGEAARKLFYADRWNIGIVEQPVSDFLEPAPEPPVRWLPAPPRDRFYADPFALPGDEDMHILFEDFDFYRSRGRISSVSIGGDGPSEPRPVMEMPIHLSYPYIVENEGEMYCIPETGERNEVALYRAHQIPSGWEKAATLIEGFRGVDSTVVLYEERWWLFATDGADGPNHKLHLWYAPALEGPWTPHPLNPIKTDIRSARPAGTPFICDGELYRPAQDCSRGYGGRISLNKITTLTPVTFAEEHVRFIEPFAATPWHDGVHTIAAAGKITIVDGMKKIFIGSHPSLLIHKLRRLFGSG